MVVPMTKLVLCLECADIVMPFRHSDTTKKWRMCECGRTGVRWKDGTMGLLLVTSALGSNYMRVIGMNNSFLYSDLVLNQNWKVDSVWREEHEQRCKTCGEHYLFNEKRRNCWACIIHIGETGDITQIPWEDKDKEEVSPNELD